MDLPPDFNDGTANEPRFLHHQVHHFLIAHVFPIKSQFFEAGTAEIKHVGSRPALQQAFNLFPGEGVFKKITLAKFKLFLQEELPCFSAGGSAAPAVIMNLHDRLPSE
jgi:hypothetical protein